MSHTHWKVMLSLSVFQSFLMFQADFLQASLSHILSHVSADKHFLVFFF